MPVCWIIAGPNGAGKTTFALEYLPAAAKCVNFVNADLIASGLSPLAPDREIVAASRIFLQEIEAHIKRNDDFAFETTLAGRSHLKLIRRLQKETWKVELVYLALPSIEMSKLRVAERVAHGGHDIPVTAIERRFHRSLANLMCEFRYVADSTRCFMNSGATPEPIFEQRQDVCTVLNETYFQWITKEAGI